MNVYFLLIRSSLLWVFMAGEWPQRPRPDRRHPGMGVAWRVVGARPEGAGTTALHVPWPEPVRRPRRPREGLGRAAELCACAGRRQLAALCDRCRRSACAQVLWKSGKINPSHTTFRSAASSFMKVLLQKTDRGEYRIPSTLPEISVNS